MRVGDGVDDEFGQVEFGGEGAKLGGYFVGSSDEVAGPFGVLGRFEGASREG